MLCMSRVTRPAQDVIGDTGSRSAFILENVFFVPACRCVCLGTSVRGHGGWMLQVGCNSRDCNTTLNGDKPVLSEARTYMRTCFDQTVLFVVMGRVPCVT